MTHSSTQRPSKNDKSDKRGKRRNAGPIDVRRGRYLSMVLRHKPATVHITLDEAGYVPVSTLLTALAQHGPAYMRFGRDVLDHLVATNSKKRYAYSPCGTKIRASQGHSVGVDLGLTPRTPPDVLFHGTATRFIASIRADGIRALSRDHVHLSADEPTAAQVGRRHGKLAMLRIDAAGMHAAGHAFYCSANGVWLTAHVPPAFIAS